jgi:acyl-lipid omega-6 desaturase (Delta-12 desaturase)
MEVKRMTDKKQINQILARYRSPDLKRSVWQLVISSIFYLIGWYLMYLSLSVSYWLTLALAIPTAGFMVRLFIIFHDCGHGAFFKSSQANNFWGMLLGFFVFTPYYQWRHEHAIHHATFGNLDKKGTGSIWTLTLEEYLDASAWEKFKYRIYRNPLIFFTLGALINFVFMHRFTSRLSNRKDRLSVHLTNLALVGIASLLILPVGFKNYLLIQLPILAIAASVGVWLFYIQHQFEGVYWERQGKWDRVEAALKGCSFYQLPRVLQWFSGNIGFHHIHHLNPSIPNYYLERCHREISFFQEIEPVRLLSGLKSLSLRLYDEAARQLVRYPPRP